MSKQTNINIKDTNSYWRNHFGNRPEKSKFPPLTGFLPAEASIYSEYSANLSYDLRERVHQYCNESGNSTAAVYYAAGIVILYRYIDESRLLFGVRVNKQKYPLCFDLMDSDSMRSIIDKVEIILSEHERNSVSESFFFHEFNFGSDDSLYEFSLSYMDTPKETVQSVFRPAFELEVFNGDSLELKIAYKTNWYKEEFVNRLVDQYIELISKLISQPDRPIYEIEIYSEEDKHKLLHTFNQTAAIYPKDKLITELFEEQVGRTPQGIALICNGESVTYDELNRKSDRLAVLLRQMGIVPERIVGILLHRSVDMVVSVLAVLKAGGAYLPLEPSYPQERNIYILENSEAALIITQSDIDFKTERESIFIDRIQSDSLEEIETSTYNGRSSNDLAYVIYTSGSTGQPKGVMVEHRQISNLIHYMQSEYKLKPAEVIVSRTNLTFDPSVWEILWPLCFGGTVRMLTKEEGMDPRFLLSLMQSEDNLKMVFLPSSLVKSILILLQKQNDRSGKIRIPLFHFGAEPISMDVLKGIYEYLNGVILNTYGPTECTVFNTYYYVSREDEKKYVSIGKPIANNQIYILSKKLRLLPLGAIGEICISGDSVSRGYINQIEKTEEKFVLNPFGEGKLYRTGDLGRFDEEGDIEIIGRIDHQIKIRGHRIELGEIENVILTYEPVEDCTVLALGSEEIKHLVAYIIANDLYNEKVLKEYLSARLPEFMVPRYLMRVDQIPLTTNGKIDRHELLKRLNEMQIAQEENQGDFTLDIVTFVLNKLKSILQVKGDIGLNDDLVGLGMNSLTFIQFIVDVEQKFGINFNEHELLFEKLDTPYSFIQFISDKSSINSRSKIQS